MIFPLLMFTLACAGMILVGLRDSVPPFSR